jgi:hypothetical protein
MKTVTIKFNALSVFVMLCSSLFLGSAHGQSLEEISDLSMICPDDIKTAKDVKFKIGLLQITQRNEDILRVFTNCGDVYSAIRSEVVSIVTKEFSKQINQSLKIKSIDQARYDVITKDVKECEAFATTIIKELGGNLADKAIKTAYQTFVDQCRIKVLYSHLVIIKSSREFTF